MPDEMEIIVLEIKITNNKPFLVLVWYRPPGTKIENFDHIERLLFSCEQEDKEIVLIGDINCDLLADEPDCYTKRLMNVTSISNIKQLIREPTRITEDSETVIDHVYVSDENKVIDSGVDHIGISDHSLVHVTIGNVKINNNGHKYHISRNYKHFNYDDFTHELDNVDWSPVYSCNDVNIAVNKFQDMFSKVCNTHAPLKKKRVRKTKSPWLTNDVIKLMRERDKVKKKIVKGGNNNDWSRYRKLKN